MPNNDITVTKNTTVGSERWDVEYTADQAATVTKTMETAGTLLDRDVKVSVITPAGSIDQLAATKGRVSNNSIGITPTVRLTGGYLPSGSTNGSTTTVTAAELVSGTKTIDAAGTTDVTNYAAVSVPEGVEGTPTNVVSPVNNHSVIVSPRVTNTEGYIPGTQKVGSNTTISASDLVSGTKTVTGSGTTDVTNYAEASVAAGSASTPATSITANPSISVNSSGLITASVSASQSVTPSVSAGWVSSGTAGTVSVSGSNTQQLSTQAAQTITPGTTDQTIAAGKYLTGAQTIKGDANLVAGNIKKDVSIFGVTGTHEGGGGWTLRYEWDFTVNTTSTSVTIIDTKTIDLPKNMFVVCVTLDRAGPRNGYYLGTYSYRLLGDYEGNQFVGYGFYKANTGVIWNLYPQYGVYCNLMSKTSAQICQRYNSTYTKTINGTYNVRIYTLDYPPNGNPYDYSFS